MAVVTLDYDPAGSDTLASGSGPAGAVTGSSATNGVGAVVNLDGSPDLSGVAVDSVLFAASASGLRHLSRILAVDNAAKTVTTEDTLTLGAGVSWAIGGKRKTLTADAAQNDISDGDGKGWTYSLASGDYPCAYAGGSAVFDLTGSSLTLGRVNVIEAPGATSKPRLTWTANAALFYAHGGGWLGLNGLDCVGSGGGSAQYGLWAADKPSLAWAVDCDFASVGAAGVLCRSRGSMTLIGGSVTTSGGNGIWADNTPYMAAVNTLIDSCSGRGVYMPNMAEGSVTLAGCRVTNSASFGIDWTPTGTFSATVRIMECVIRGSGSHGLYMGGAFGLTGGPGMMCNNIFAENVGYGMYSSSAAIDFLAYADYNAFYNNTSGSYNNITAGTHDVALSADPFTDAAGGDFTLNNAAGGGAAIDTDGLGYAGP